MHSTVSARVARRRGPALVAGVALALGASIVAANPAQAATPVDDGQLSWGFKYTFRNYVGSQTAALPPIGPVPMGQRITLVDPAGFDLAGTPATPSNTSTPNETLPYLLPVTGGEFTDEANLRIETSGGVDYHFPSHFFEIGISNVAIVVEDGDVTIEGDVDSVVTGDFGDFTEGEFHEQGVELGAVANGVVTRTGDSVTVSGTGVTLTAAGAEFLPYNEGDGLDDFSVTASLAPAAPVWSPQITLSQETGFNPDGSQTVVVNGTGFDPAANTSTRAPVTAGQSTGVYVIFGKFADSWKPSANGSGRKIISQKWAIPEPSKTQVATDYPSQAAQLVELNADGTFTAELQVVPDDTVDGNYGVYTYAAGGAAANAAQELFVPVSFAGDDSGLDVDVTVPEAPVEPGAFAWTIDGAGAVSLGTAVATAAGFTASGSLPTITVRDTREGAPAWSISGQSSAFTGTAGSFGGQSLGWAPAVSENTVGAVAGAVAAPGLAVGDGLSVARTLASSAAGHDLGEVTVDAGLSLLAPASAAAGDYTATLTLTALS